MYVFFHIPVKIIKNHDGIIVLPAETAVGSAVKDFYKIEKDFVFEIGLTPNRMDAMSHLGVARDVCAYLSFHQKKQATVKSPWVENVNINSAENNIIVSIEKNEACSRYCGVSISGITVAESPLWLQQKLKSIGLKPINNIVDITNFILHETGQPLHAFDADQIKGNKIIVKTVAEGTLFKTLDEKERKLSENDLMICDEAGPLCIASTVTRKVLEAFHRVALTKAPFTPSTGWSE